MAKRNILILDCTRNSEPSEGRLLKEFFDICRLHRPKKATSLYYKIKSKKDFLNKLNTGKHYSIIHIAAHGPDEGEVGLGNGSTWLARPEELKKTKPKTTLLHASACSASNKILANSFQDVDFYLAPKTEIDWINAAIFSMLFYKRYIVDGISMQSSFEYARRRTHTCKDYPNYWE